MDDGTFDQQLIDVFIQLSQGDLTARLPRTGARDERDVIAYLVNVLAEELSELFAERERARIDLESMVLELGEVLTRHAAGDFSAQATRRLDGSPADVLAFQVNAAGEEIDGLVTDLQKQRERIEREARTRAASRLSAISVLAAGVSHELNNPLSFTLMNLQLIQEQLQELAEAGDGRFDDMLLGLRDAEAGVHRVSSISQTLKQLAPGPHAADVEVDVATTVDSSLRMLRNVVDQRATLTCTHQDPLIVRADVGRLGQVVINLVHNAALAFEASSPALNRIDVETRREDRLAVIEIRDNGVGIPAEHIHSIFDAFFSTRREQDGTGLGLSISRQTMLEFGGDLTAESTVGEGSLFRATLPVCDEISPAAGGPQEQPSSHVMTGRAQVLVVDDEPSVVTIISRILKSHDVTTETRGATAIERLGEMTFDLVLCDMMMPDVDGEDVYRAWCESDSREASFVIITGGAFTKKAQDFIDQGNVPVCYKPMNVPLLRGLVDDALLQRSERTVE